MTWDDQYRQSGQLWGNEPGILAVAAVNYLTSAKPVPSVPFLLDIGCGYGRDAFFISGFMPCRILGIDVSERSIAMGTARAAETGKQNIQFQRMDFTSLGAQQFDIVFISNLYQILHPEQRDALRKMAARVLRRGGLLMLSTLSVNDPEHYAKGRAVPGERNSYEDNVYLHFCTRDELVQDFAFLTVRSLEEHDYHEPRVTGEVHHHVSWLLIGTREDR